MAEATPLPAGPSLTRGFVSVTAATVIGNVCAYVLLLSAARVLASDEYARLVVLFNLLAVGTVPAFALQTVVARRVALGHADHLVRTGGIFAAGVGVLFVVLAPLEVAFLHLPSSWSAVVLAAALPGIALQGLCQGIWQGGQAFSALALTTFAGLVGRCGAGLVGLAVGGTATTAMLALTLGVTLTAGVCLWTVRGLTCAAAGRRQVSAAGPTSSRSVLVETGRAAHAYGVFLLLSVTDVLLATHVLTHHAAAVYAAGSVMTKAALWLPQSAANVLFASLTDHGRHRRLFIQAVAGLAGLGAVLVAGCLLLSGVVTTVVAGNKYPELHTDVWLFAALGSCLALSQFALISGLAIRDAGATLIVWLTIAAEAVYVLALDPHGGVGSIVRGVLVVNVIAAGAALLQRAARPAAVPPLSLGPV